MARQSARGGVGGRGCNLSRHLSTHAVGLSGQVPRNTRCAPTAAAAMAAGLRTAGFDEVREVPLADGGEGTLDALLAARGGSRRNARSPGRWATPSTRSGRCCPTAPRWSRWRGPAGSRSSGRNDPLRAIDARHRGADRRRVPRRRDARHRRRRRERDDRRRARPRSRRSGWSLAGLDVVVACDVDDARSSTRREVYGPQKGASDARGRAAHAPARAARRASTSSGPGSTSRELEGGGAAGGLAGGLAALGARLEPGLRRRRRRPRVSTTRSTARSSSSPARAGSTSPASRARSSAACSSGRPTLGVPHRAVIVGPGHRRGPRGAQRRSATCRCSRSPTGSGRPARRSPAPPSSSRRPRSKPAVRRCGATRRAANGSLTAVPYQWWQR